MSNNIYKGELKESVIEAINYALVQDVDGLYYFDTGHGYFADYHLRIIADELEKRNKDWNDTINTYLEKNNV